MALKGPYISHRPLRSSERWDRVVVYIHAPTRIVKLGPMSGTDLGIFSTCVQLEASDSCKEQGSIYPGFCARRLIPRVP